MAAPGALTGVVSSTGTGTSALVTLPSGTADKVFILAVDGSPTLSTPTGWTKIQKDSNGAAVAFYWRDNTAETSVSVTWTGTETWNSLAGTSPDTDFSADAPTLSTGATAVNSNPDPDNITVDSGDYRILAVYGADRGNRSATGWPSGYTDNNDETSDGAGGGTNVGWASIGRTGITSDDPGTFTVSGGVGWSAFTVALPETAAAPAAPVVRRRQLTTVRM